MPDTETLVRDKNLFNSFVYTSLDDAVNALMKRRTDSELMKRVESFLGPTLPSQFQTDPRLVLARHLVTPDHEIIRFLNVSDVIHIPPLFFEYLGDKLVFKNPAKYRLARLSFYKGIGKKGGVKRDERSIIDFDEAHGKPISSVKTTDNRSLVDVHHQLFLRRFPGYEDALFDGTTWYAENGGTPLRYYPKFIALFLCHGILFENFFLDRKELEFTKDIFLPAFIEVFKKFGVKPLIVALEPTQLEGDDFWLDHPYSDKALFDTEDAGDK
jgi:hypothetical protein